MKPAYRRPSGMCVCVKLSNFLHDLLHSSLFLISKKKQYPVGRKCTTSTLKVCWIDARLTSPPHWAQGEVTQEETAHVVLTEGPTQEASKLVMVMTTPT
jgi:hypothetical protein